jgi:AcrR family transcriptional regulator
MSSGPKAGATRERIEAAALALFAERGVDGASMRDLAREVGLTEGAIYRHFASKEELARALFLRHYGALAREIETVRAAGLPFEARVRALVDLFVQRFDADPAAFAYVLISQHAHLGGLDRQSPDNAVEALARVLRDAMAAGEIPYADIDLVTALALGLVVQPAIFRIYGRLDQPPSAHADAIAAAVFGLLRGGASADGLAKPRSDPDPKPRDGGSPA